MKLMKKFTRAIVRKPCKQLAKGLSDNQLGIPDYEKALKQHKSYVSALQTCGLSVITLEADERFPDSVFVEDTAVCTSEFAVLSRPGAPEREKERDIMLPELKKHFNKIEYIKKPGFLDGGDIMQVNKTFYIGISKRTNHEGGDQFIDIMKKYGMKGIKVPLSTLLHLKTGMSYLEHTNLLISGEFIQNSLFDNFHKIVIDDSEQYAANSLWINETVLVPAAYPKTAKQIQNAGYKVLLVDISEFRKLDGGLSCLSLRF